MNPFNLTFGVKSENYIPRIRDFNTIVDYFVEDQDIGRSYLISGVRGSGKTAMLTEIGQYFKELDNWIVVELIPNEDVLEQFAAKLIDATKIKKFSFNFEASFSFSGLTFSLSGKERILNIATLIEAILKTLKKKEIRVLVCIDDVSKSEGMRIFSQEYQYLVRNNYLLYLLMTGLYNNIYDLQNDKSLTFLLRTPKITIEPLLLAAVSAKYQALFSINKKEADAIAIMSKGYAFCFQLLGRILWEKKKTKPDEEVCLELDQTLYEYAYERIYAELSDQDRKVIKAFQEERIYEAKEILEATGFGIKQYSLYRDRLIKRGLLISKGYGKTELILPRFNLVIQKFDFQY